MIRTLVEVQTPLSPLLSLPAQVKALGCKSFALLFDDIDCDMCPADGKVFASFAHAQVSIANEIFAHLDRPEVFLFCPTG